MTIPADDHCFWCNSRTHGGSTFTNEILDVLIEALPVTFAPQPHVSGVVLPAALVCRAHGEQLPPIAGVQELLLPAIQPGPTRSKREAVIGNVNKARVVPPIGETSAALLVSPGVRLVPVVGADRHGQHTQGTQR